jgi:hypothetical protein
MAAFTNCKINETVSGKKPGALPRLQARMSLYGVALIATTSWGKGATPSSFTSGSGYF